MSKTWSENQLINAVKTSFNYVEVFEKLGLSKRGSYKIIKQYISCLNLDTSHFLNRKQLNKNSRSARKIRDIHSIFIENGSYADAKQIKALILKEDIFTYECAICTLNSWQNKDITLQLDHINGINSDNRLENLRLLCPNCHSQTDTFCGRKLKQNKEINYCKCGKVISALAAACKSCVGKRQKTKINWPPSDVVKTMAIQLGYVEVGKRLGVSDNAVRKYLKRMGL